MPRKGLLWKTVPAFVLCAALASQAREIAAVQGFFDAQASVAIDRDASPVVVTVTR